MWKGPKYTSLEGAKIYILKNNLVSQMMMYVIVGCFVSLSDLYRVSTNESYLQVT